MPSCNVSYGVGLKQKTRRRWSRGVNTDNAIRSNTRGSAVLLGFYAREQMHEGAELAGSLTTTGRTPVASPDET